MSKKRLDVFLTENGLCPSRERAQAVIMCGDVYVGGQRALKPGMMIDEKADVDVRGETMKFVSRGGYKLEKALDEFGVTPAGWCCLDCGASTGGFTDCLLQRGARRVYAIDVGYGQLAWRLRSDERVVVMERTNVRHLTPDVIPEKAQLAVVDVSFISLKLVLPAVKSLLTGDGLVICLIKPQFEAGRLKVGKKGVVRDRETHVEVLQSFVQNAENSGFQVKSVTFSPIKGPEGNIEFLGCLALQGAKTAFDLETIVSEAHRALEGR
ncbi:TlyA family RNA methyltransferase [Oscillospiraceae bacterium CM]|nr:TlyA family RNA methyltransferase [Oscillospiraceae bacterium CM]